MKSAAGGGQKVQHLAHNNPSLKDVFGRTPQPQSRAGGFGQNLLPHLPLLAPVDDGGYGAKHSLSYGCAAAFVEVPVEV